jgi:hypothetical protein
MLRIKKRYSMVLVLCRKLSLRYSWLMLGLGIGVRDEANGGGSSGSPNEGEVRCCLVGRRRGVWTIGIVCVVIGNKSNSRTDGGRMETRAEWELVLNHTPNNQVKRMLEDTLPTLSAA